MSAGWVKAEVCVPPPDVEVLCYYERDGLPQMEVGQYWVSVGFAFSDDDGRSSSVTHWQPLPPPPSDGKP